MRLLPIKIFFHQDVANNLLQPFPFHEHETFFHSNKNIIHHRDVNHQYHRPPTPNSIRADQFLKWRKYEISTRRA